jgi:hypothetical protein
MVWIATGEENNLRGMMIDGYAPSFEYLKQLDWRRLRTEGYFPKGYRDRSASSLPKYLGCKYLGRENLSEKTLLKLFGNLVDEFRLKFCPFRNRNRPSLFRSYTSSQNYYSLENRTHRQMLGELLLPLTDEYRHDQERGRSLYVQNVVIFHDHPIVSCDLVKECCENWIDILGLKIKKKEEYKNYEAFEKAWLKILNRELEEAEKYDWFKGCW